MLCASVDDEQVKILINDFNALDWRKVSADRICVSWDQISSKNGASKIEPKFGTPGKHWERDLHTPVRSSGQPDISRYIFVVAEEILSNSWLQTVKAN